MRILLCDDDPRILEQLQRYLYEYFENKGGVRPEFAAYSSADDLLTNETHADIAFLDVEMSGKSGIEASAVLKSICPRIIIFIVTSYPDYLDEAMREQVFRFLDKPIDKNRLFRNMNDAIYQYNAGTKEVPVITARGIELVRADEIICIETSRRKTCLITTTDTFETNMGIEYWRKTLNLPCFYSSHRGVIINMRYVFRVGKDTVMLKYKCFTKEVYLSRRKYKEFKELYLLYLESMK